jgi:DMSO/TMAO reductase YedYZ molybdopterin-dependent catalytic subunit
VHNNKKEQSLPERAKVRETLPVHAHKGQNAQNYVLRVDCLVSQCLDLTFSDLETLPQQDFTDDFTCLEGWTVPNLTWHGVPLQAVLSLARPSPEARFVQASAGEFSVPLPLEKAKQALLATRLNQAALPLQHGGPIRLIVPGGQCFTSIKWLDHLELREDAAVNTAETIALGRLPGTSTDL